MSGQPGRQTFTPLDGSPQSVVVLKMAVWKPFTFLVLLISKFYFLDSCEWDHFPYVFLSVFAIMCGKAINVLGGNFCVLPLP